MDEEMETPKGKITLGAEMLEADQVKNEEQQAFLQSISHLNTGGSN